MNLKNRPTSYTLSLGDHAPAMFDQVPKTIWATIALSYATNHLGLDWDQVAHEVAKEWATLADNGICPQPPQALLKIWAPDVIEDRKQDAARAQAQARAEADRISTATAQDAVDFIAAVIPPFGMIAAANGIDAQAAPTFRFDAEAEAARADYFRP